MVVYTGVIPSLAAAEILLKSLLGLKLQTFRPALSAFIHDWRWSKIFPIVLYHFDQNIILQSWLLYIVIYVYHTHTKTVEVAVAYTAITRVYPAVTVGGRWGEYTSKVLKQKSDKRTTGKENRRQET